MRGKGTPGRKRMEGARVSRGEKVLTPLRGKCKWGFWGGKKKGGKKKKTG